MLTYMDGDNILFSNDAFGQHFASESLYNNTVNQADLMYEAEKYYANILNLYSPLVKKKIDQILAMNLPVDMICPSHGIIWKENPMQIVEKYIQWSNAYQENQITIAYDTMWQSTRKMAEAIAEGIRSVDNDVTLKIVNVAHDDKNDVLTEMFHSKAVLIGSPTINYGISFAISGLLEMMKGLKMRNKKAAAFGSYGWSGDAVKIINNLLKEGGFELVDDGLAKLWVPDEQTIEECREYGRNFAKSL